MTSKTSLLALLAVLILAGFAGTAPVAAGAGAQATFVRTDATTQGNWVGVYGRDGYVIPDANANKSPSYAAFNPQDAAAWTWTNNGAETRDPQVSWNPTSRQASCWYTYASVNYTLDVNVTDGNAHQFSLYALDWDGRGRTETIQAVDGASGAVLNTQNISNFAGGIYLVWNISGHVKFVVRVTGGPNGVLSGAFFDPTSSASATTPSAKAQFVTTDTATQGNWMAAYGADGYANVGDSQKNPSYATITSQNAGFWIWANTTTDQRAQKLANNTGRIAATWFNAPSFGIDVNITDSNTHQVAVYALDWDNKGRAETIRVLDAKTNAVLDSKSVFNFTNGMYLVWNVSGHVTISVTSTSGPNAVISGVYFGGKSATTTPSTPTTTQTQTTTTQTQTSGTPTVTAQGKLSLNQTSFNFGTVNISSSSTQTFSVTNSGNANVTISNVSVSGAGFNASGVPTGTVITPGQSITLNVSFAPASTSTVTGGVTLTSNASNPSAAITLSGSGKQMIHSVALSWNASSSSGIVGYEVYRGTVAAGPYMLMTSSPVSSTSFTDSTAQGGQTYYYVVTSLDSSNTQSAYSNMVTATIP